MILYTVTVLIEWFGEGLDLQVLTRPIQVSRKRGVDALYPSWKFAWKIKRVYALGIEVSHGVSRLGKLHPGA